MYVGSLKAFSNREDWTECFRAVYTDPDTKADEDIDLTGCSVELAVYDAENCLRLQGSIDTGEITLSEYTTGEGFSVIRWKFDKERTRCLMAGSYNVGITLANNDQTVQLFVGTVPVVHGYVP